VLPAADVSGVVAQKRKAWTDLAVPAQDQIAPLGEGAPVPAVGQYAVDRHYMIIRSDLRGCAL
jgi:hypothetical protein